jgi:hypothetical protein
LRILRATGERITSSGILPLPRWSENRPTETRQSGGKEQIDE